MIYLLDTNHASRLLDNDPAILAHILTLNVATDRLATTVTVRGELAFMVEASSRRAANHIRLLALLSRLLLLELDPAVADNYGLLKAQLFAAFGPKGRKRHGQTTQTSIGVSENDLWIAATALRYGVAVVSADQDFERIHTVAPELAVVRWWTP